MYNVLKEKTEQIENLRKQVSKLSEVTGLDPEAWKPTDEFEGLEDTPIMKTKEENAFWDGVGKQLSLQLRKALEKARAEGREVTEVTVPFKIVLNPKKKG